MVWRPLMRGEIWCLGGWLMARAGESGVARRLRASPESSPLYPHLSSPVVVRPRLYTLTSTTGEDTGEDRGGDG